jgi:RimJ/RimL family protein N-acetyltransferase
MIDSPVNVRFAGPWDAAAISDLVRARSSKLGYGTAEEFEKWFGTRYSVPAILSRISDPEIASYVAVDHGDLLGYAHANLSTGELGGMHVAADGNGVGTLLSAALIELAVDARMPRVWLTVATHNSRLIDHALRNGFTYERVSQHFPPTFTSTQFLQYEKFLPETPEAPAGQIFIVTDPNVDRHDPKRIIGFTTLDAAMADRLTKRGSTIDTVHVIV